MKNTTENDSLLLEKENRALEKVFNELESYVLTQIRVINRVIEFCDVRSKEILNFSLVIESITLSEIHLTIDNIQKPDREFIGFPEYERNKKANKILKKQFLSIVNFFKSNIKIHDDLVSTESNRFEPNSYIMGAKVVKLKTFIKIDSKFDQIQWRYIRDVEELKKELK